MLPLVLLFTFIWQTTAAFRFSPFGKVSASLASSELFYSDVDSTVARRCN
jgi:hypothetical protein